MTLNVLELTALAILATGLLLGLLRLVIGPHAGDRVVAADTLSVITTALLAVVAALLDSALYLDIALVYGVLSFIGVIALARTIEGRRS